MRQTLFIVLLGLLTAVGFSQTTARKIQAQDKLKVTCSQESLLSKIYSVSKDGVILVDFLGAVEVQGLTEPEAANLISKRLVEDRILKTATVDVKVMSATGETPTQPDKPSDVPAPIKYSGAISSNGQVAFTEGMKLSDVIKLAQPNDNTDLAQITVKSVGGGVLAYDMTKPENDIALKAGDEVMFLPKAAPTTAEVYVFGGVAKPGMLKLETPATVKKAIEAAGGLTNNAIKKRIRVERDGQSAQQINYETTEADTLLKASDRIVVEVSDSRAYVQVDGAVNNPGFFVVTTGMKLGDAIRAAGGFKKEAKTEKVKITSPNAKKPKVVNFAEIEQGYSGDIVLQAGDQVAVEGNRRKNNLPVKIGLGVAAYWFLFRR